MKKKKIIFSVLLLLVLLGGFGLYKYYQPPADVRQQAAQIQITANDLVAAFNADETKANAQYLDKIIEVKGTVAEVKLDSMNQATIFLQSSDPLASVTCSFYEEEAKAAQHIQPGSVVAIKGKCTGKLMDVVLNKCSISSEK